VFKLDYSELNNYPIPKGKPFSWLNTKATYKCHMGLEREFEIFGDLENLEKSCLELSLCLPSEFTMLMKSPNLWSKFRSMNSGFFDIREKPIKCPTSSGFLIPFISDQQYCHYYYLHISPNTEGYLILWADASYGDAIYASPEDFERDYKEDFDKNNIYLINDDFERFMYGHYEKHEGWFKEHEKFLVDNGYTKI